MDVMSTRKAEEFAKELAGNTTPLNELQVVMRSLLKSVLERMLNSELDVHLSGGSSDSRTAATLGS
ncbi:hypothetical protein [Aureliella helgolandensis]|uniref:Transposase, Mutator family n=1 Tax=Aureliella helgolandensis TaxID=2527968 RepID=A0A518G6H5_9BACT|nr:hypothetical protein [Aureliella helgolandensis]QDV24179.1 hypothetical protein Q31a_24930 [Aureliella helgolandensis]